MLALTWHKQLTRQMLRSQVQTSEQAQADWTILHMLMLAFITTEEQEPLWFGLN